MDQRLDNIDKRLDTMVETLHAIDKTLIKQEANLRDHKRRSLANERATRILQRRLDAELTPIKRHIAGLNYLVKAIGIIAIVLSSVFSTLKAYDYLMERSAKGEKSHVSTPQKTDVRQGPR